VPDGFRCLTQALCDPGGAWAICELVDLDSHNGTFVNGVPVGRKFITTRYDPHRQLRIRLSNPRRRSAATAKLRLSDASSKSMLTTSAWSSQPRIQHSAPRLDAWRATSPRCSESATPSTPSATLNCCQRELLRLISEVVPADHGAVLLQTDLDEETNSICTWKPSTDAAQTIEIQRELVHRAIWERSAVFTNDASTSSDTPNVLCLPLVAVERTIGVIYLTSLHPAPPFREDHIHFLDSVSRIAAVTLETYLALDALRSENQRLKRELNPASNLVGESRQIRQLEESSPASRRAIPPC